MKRNQFGFRISDCGLDATPAASAAASGSIRNPQSTIRNSGFTLIELLVVIVVILILLGLAAGVGSWAVGTGEEQLTKTALVNAQLLYEEYTNTVGGSVASTSELVIKTKTLAAFKVFYSKLPPQVMDYAGNSIKDAWGKPLIFVPTSNARAAYFFSSGRDGNQGTTTDNLYSYDAVK